MTAPTGSPPGSGAAWCRQFVERRCGSFVAAALTDEGDQDEAEYVAGTSVLSLAEGDLAVGAPDAAELDHLAVLALRTRREPGASVDPLGVRFITPSAIRSAGHVYGSRRLVSDIVIPTPAALDEISLLVYRIRRTPRLGRVLNAVERAVETLRAAGDDPDLVLARAVLEQLEVLDDPEDAAIVVSGRQLRFGSLAPERNDRYVAVVGVPPGASPVDKLRLTDRKLYEGRDRASAARVDGRPYLLLRFGPRSTRQSGREFVAEVRRRQGPSEGGPGGGEPLLAARFASLVRRETDQGWQDVIKATFGHHEASLAITPIVLEVAADLRETIALDSNLAPRFHALIEDMRRAVRERYGVLLPGVRGRLSESAPAGTYTLMLDEVPFEGGAVNPTRLLCLASADALSAAFFGRASDARLDATAATLPDGSGRAACWIPVARGAEARAAGYETLDAAAYIAIHLRSLLVANLELFAGLEEIERSLSEVAGAGEAAGGTLLGRVKAAKGGLPRFAEVARSLLMDELPIEPMGRVASRYLELAGRPDAEIAEELRLLPAVNAHLTRDVAGWRLLVLAQDYEARVRAGIRREGTDAVLVLQPEHAQELYAGVRSELEAAEGGERSVVVVEDASLRPFIHSMLLVEFPRLLVVARRELQGLGELPAPTATVGAGA